MPRSIGGLPVIDAKKPLTVHITANDITGSNRKRPDECAAARAIVRDCHAKEALVYRQRIYVRFNEQNWQRFKTPESIRQELIAYDRGGTFEPGTFQVPRLIGRDRVTGRQQGSKTNQTRPARIGPPRPAPLQVKNIRLTATNDLKGHG